MTVLSSTTPRRDRRARPAAALAAALLAAAALAGCKGFRSWQPPPSAVGDALPTDPGPLESRVTVVGHFENPDVRALEWPTLGPRMAELMARTLLNHGSFHVVVDPALADRVHTIASMQGQSREQALADLRLEHPQVRFVINGKVTDFIHTADLPARMRRTRTLGWGRVNEAVAAIRLDVFDLDLGRVVATDHLYGTQKVSGSRATDKYYENVAFDSVIFWSSPLGRAAEKAIDQSVVQTARLIPEGRRHLQVVRRTGPRRVVLQVEARAEYWTDKVCYLYAVDEAGGFTPIIDLALGTPVTATVQGNARRGLEAILSGPIPSRFDPTDTVLLEHPNGAAPWETANRDAGRFRRPGASPAEADASTAAASDDG